MGAKCSCGCEAVEEIQPIASTPEDDVRLWCPDCSNEFDFKQT